jgi:hypothetical protein
MLSWIIEHIVVFVINQIVLIPYRLGGMCRKGFEHGKAGYKGAALKIIVPPLSLASLSVIIFILAGVYVSWISVVSIWGLGIVGFFNCDVSGGLKQHQAKYQKIEPWIKDFKAWYQQDVHNNQVSWDDYLLTLTLAYGSYALRKFSEESTPEKEAQLQSYFVTDAQNNTKLEIHGYLGFLADNLGNELRQKWADICRDDTKYLLKLTDSWNNIEPLARH